MEKTILLYEVRDLNNQVILLNDQVTLLNDITKGISISLYHLREDLKKTQQQNELIGTALYWIIGLLIILNILAIKSK